MNNQKLNTLNAAEMMPKKENEKICPMMGKPCTDKCSWYNDTYEKCSVSIIGNELHDLTMSLAGEYPDEAAAILVGYTGEVAESLVDLVETVKSIDSRM
ncbi:MAG: hypothetical protein NC548_46545 [Lachnospiraceae bacterium]|nr:hypothetical protein [Lachnospiraceae bacterium]MCM1227672.1 hypothetical protein [Clostridium sp.]